MSKTNVSTYLSLFFVIFRFVLVLSEDIIIDMCTLNFKVQTYNYVLLLNCTRKELLENRVHTNTRRDNFFSTLEKI